jgi:hypothetical protein
MKKMDIGDIKPREVIKVEEDKDQVQVSGSHDQNQASSSSQAQDYQQVSSTSSLPNDQPSARNQVQVLQPSNVARDHPLDSIIGDISRGVQIISRLASFYEHFSFVSSIEPKKIDETLKDVDWINTMHEELNNFKRNQLWELVERPKDHNMIRSKWVFRNKQDQDGIVIRNKVRLVAQDYTQVEGLDFGETHALVARLEAIRIF